jgi:hypothetical protein
MTRSDDPLTPAEEEVRRLLAEARHTGPTPPEVVARLDTVLEDLTQESSGTAPVVELARRRRRVGALLVAAAAVVAVGVGVGQVVTGQSGGEASQAGDAGTVAGAAEREAAQPEAQPNGSQSNAAGKPVEVSPLEDSVTLSSVRPNHFADDLTAARRAPREQGSFSSKADSADAAAGALCSADAWGTGRFVPVRYGKTPAVLVFRRPVGDTQVVDLFLCGSKEPVRSVTLPAP